MKPVLSLMGFSFHADHVDNQSKQYAAIEFQLADGWHMGTHTIAIGITVFAYKYARQKNSDLTFTFGTWKVEVLGGYTSAILLIVIAASMGFESMERLYEPRDIDFKYALPIAFVGLITNVLCMLVLGHHDHGLEKHHHYRHQDLNMRAAYVHVLTDAITSVLAILALTAGLFFGWNWLDPAMGIVGAVLVLIWSRSLLIQTTKILLDRRAMNDETEKLVDSIKQSVSKFGSLNDLKIWKIDDEGYACIIKMNVDNSKSTRSALDKELAAFPLSYRVLELDDREQ